MPTAAELMAGTVLISVSMGSTLDFCFLCVCVCFQVADWSNHSTYLKS